MIGDIKSIDKMSERELRAALREARQAISALTDELAGALTKTEGHLQIVEAKRRHRLAMKAGEAFLRTYR